MTSGVVLMIRPPPTLTLVPYTPLFRSPAGKQRRIHAIGHYQNNAASPLTFRFDDFIKGKLNRPPNARAASASDRKSTRLNSSHANISYAVFCLKKKKHPNPSLSFFFPP